MTIYTFPPSLWRLASLQFSLEPFSSSTPVTAWNPYTFSDGPITEVWKVRATIVPQVEADWRDLSALLRNLRGRRNKIRLYDPSRTLRGAGAAGPTINAAAAAAKGATSITVRGLTVSQAVALAADDVFGSSENLYAASAAVASDASGEATVSFLPPLRLGVAEGDAISLQNPTGLFQLREGADSGVVVPGNIRQAVTLDFLEDPDVD